MALVLGSAPTLTVDAATLTVDDSGDAAVNLADTAVTLRDAIFAAENDVEVAPGGPSGSGSDTIEFASSLTAVGDVTIKLTVFDTGLDDGEAGPTAFRITTSVAIHGPSGDNGITLERSGTSKFRFFHVATGGALSLENLGLVGGIAQGGQSVQASAGGGGGGAGIGGAIVNQGSVFISRCTFSENQAVGGSGAGGSSSQIDGGGAGGGGVGGNSSNSASFPQEFRAGGNPNGGDTSGEDGGVGGGGAGGFGRSGADSVGDAGGDGGIFGGGGAGGGAFGGGATTATGGPGGNGGFGGGGGGGGPARATGGPETGGAGGTGGFGGGSGTEGGLEIGGRGGSGGGAAGMGGAIFNNAGTLNIANSTFSGNTAQGGSSGGFDEFGNPTGSFAPGGAGSGFGAAIFNRNGTMNVFSTTIANNIVLAGSTDGGTAGSASGAIYTLGDNATASIALNNTIVSNTTGGTSFVSNTINSGGSTSSGVGNLIDTQTGFGGTIVTTADPLLLPLADNRGPTETHAIPAASPALDAGDDASADMLLTDQRGGIFSRIADGNLDGTTHVDIGAFERVQLDYGDAPDFLTGTGPASILLESGTDDARISKMGNDSETDPNVRASFSAFRPDIAYNATNDEFFVVWYGDDDTTPLVDGENEIFGQRVNASTGAPVGGRIRISAMGPDGDTSYFAFNPAVAWNSVNNTYLVVWQGDDNTPPLVDNENEIHGKILTSSGGTSVAQFRISTMGNDSESDPSIRTNFRADNPSVAFNATDNEFLVAWNGNDNTIGLDDNETEVFAQRLNGASGGLLGTRFRVSQNGPDGSFFFRASDPAVAWNSVNNLYVIVWAGDDDTPPLVDNENEIHGAIFDHLGGVSVPQFRISTMGNDAESDPNNRTNFRADSPRLAYDPVASQVLVVWHGDDDTPPLVNDETEVFGQRVNAQTGTLNGPRLRISRMGPDGDTSHLGFSARVAYSSATHSFLVVWHGDDVIDNEFEVYGRRVSGAGTFLDSTQARLSTMGPDESTMYTVLQSNVAFGAAGRSFVVWSGDDNTAPVVNDEYEIFSQTVLDQSLVDYQTRGSENGPAHKIRVGIRMGANIDDETNAQPSLQADGDDLSTSDDEDGPSGGITMSLGFPTLGVIVTNTTGSPATLAGWIDYDGDGVFENATERATAPVPDGSVDLGVALSFPVQPFERVSPTLVRLRLSTDAAALDPTGFAEDGEVEDHFMTVPPGLTPTPTRTPTTTPTATQTPTTTPSATQTPTTNPSATRTPTQPASTRTPTGPTPTSTLTPTPTATGTLPTSTPTVTGTSPTSTPTVVTMHSVSEPLSSSLIGLLLGLSVLLLLRPAGASKRKVD